MWKNIQKLCLFCRRFNNDFVKTLPDTISVTSTVNSATVFFDSIDIVPTVVYDRLIHVSAWKTDDSSQKLYNVFSL